MKFRELSFRKMTILFLLSFIFLLILPLQPIAQIDFGSSESFNEELPIDISLYSSKSSFKAGNEYDFAVVTEISKPWHINSANPHEDWLIATELKIDSIAGFSLKSVDYPSGYDIDFSGTAMSVYGDSTVITFKIAIDENISDGSYSIPIHFAYQPCNDKECRSPQSIDKMLKIKVGEEGEDINSGIFAVNGNPEASEKQNTDSLQENEIQRLIDEHGFWGYIIALGLAFITGLLLSFSPCTYPMIPITVSIFAGQNRSVGRGFIMSLFYVGSMAFVYGIMGLIVAMVGGVFGAWLASPSVVIGIAIVFVIFALSMFGLYELQVPSSLRQKLGSSARGKGGILGVIILGVVAALVVSPCVGPFVAGILLYIATSGSPAIGFLVLFVFALGLGTLYVILGTFSSSINALPGAGEWMETIKKFFGFVLLLMALYFVRTIISQELLAILTSLLLLSFGVFGGGMDRLLPESGFFPRLKKFLGLIAFAIGIYLLLGSLITQGLILPPISELISFQSTGMVKHQENEIEWIKDLENGLKRAKADNKPIVIDTWATWCANCKVLEKKTFGDPDFISYAKSWTPVKVQLEQANSQITKDFMARFGLKQFSLPTTLLLDADGNVKKVIQGVIEPGDLIAEMKKVK
ncbi:MAG: cytochrome c biogenesis protein CcdA [bacterium]